tara:strand:+ start:21106 stop:21411 length:306 start_codon:yes stop_codon:yes gene_type:complete
MKEFKDLKLMIKGGNEMNTETITGFYGNPSQECDVLVCHDIDDCGGKWYVVAGSSNVNYTMLPLSDGVNVERVIDEDYYSWSNEINTEAELVESIEEVPNF